MDCSILGLQSAVNDSVVEALRPRMEGVVPKVLSVEKAIKRFTDKNRDAVEQLRKWKVRFNRLQKRKSKPAAPSPRRAGRPLKQDSAKERTKKLMQRPEGISAKELAVALGKPERGVWATINEIFAERVIPAGQRGIKEPGRGTVYRLPERKNSPGVSTGA